MFIPKLYTNSVLSSLNSRPRKGNTNQWETQADNETHSLSNAESQQTGTRHLNMQIMSAKDNARNQARSRAVGQSGGTAVSVLVLVDVSNTNCIGFRRYLLTSRHMLPMTQNTFT